MYQYRKTFFGVLILFLLISSKSSAKTYKWDDFTKPFKEKMGYIDSTGSVKVAVYLPKVIKQHRSLTLVIISDIIDEEAKPYLRFNNQNSPVYDFSHYVGLNTKKVKIETNILKAGLNILHFENRSFYGGIYTIEELHFDLKDIVLQKDAKIVSPQQQGQKIPKAKDEQNPKQAGSSPEEQKIIEKENLVPKNNAPAPVPPQSGSNYAVVIGIGTYQDKRIPPLKYTTADAEAIYALLTDPKQGNFSKDQIKLLINEQATYKNIKSAIGTWIKRQSRKDDTVIIFFAGHGAPEEEKTYWVPYDANINDLYGTALSNNEIADMFDRVESKKMIAFLDSCYSAATTGRDRSIKLVGDPFQKFKGRGRVIITSSDGKQQSLELDEYGHGVFTYHLINALKGKADENNDGFIELDEAWNYIKQRVTETARRQGSTQTPVLDGTYSAGIVLSKNPKRVDEIEQEREREKKKRELEGWIATLRELYIKDEISSTQFDKAVKILKAGTFDKILDDFLAGKITLLTFKEAFK